MLHTLRRQLVLSHILPPLCIIPMLGLALIYVLETQVVLPSLAQELEEQARLVVAVAGDQPGVWGDPVLAQGLVARLDPGLTARLMLLTPDGHLLASSNRADSARLGQQLALPGLLGGLGRQTSVRVAYSQQPDAEIVDVLAPVVGPDQRIVGVVRLTHQMASVSGQFVRLRYLITAVLAIGLLLGAAAGWALALNLARPLRQVTQAIHGLAGGQHLTPLPEAGPEEVGLLARVQRAGGADHRHGACSAPAVVEPGA